MFFNPKIRLKSCKFCTFLHTFAHFCTHLHANNMQIFTTMATTKLYLDTRAAKKGQPSPLKLAVVHKSSTALLKLNVSLLPNQWDKTACKVINHPQKNFLNTYLAQRKLEADTEILRLIASGDAKTMSATEIKNHLSGKDEKKDESVLFSTRFLKFAERKKASTKEIYMHTYGRIKAFDDKYMHLAFEDITKDWLHAFDEFLSKTSPSKNARNIHLRNIRAVFNDAIDDEITTYYPFRRFKIRPVPTAKRSLTIEQLRELFNYPVEDYAVRYLDMFKLIFFLIGINLVDLFALRQITNDGRIEYTRSKTGRKYSIKVEPEAMEIINKYRGKNNLVSISEDYKSHKDYMKRINTALQRIGDTEIGKHGAKTFRPMFPQLTTYWARHTWATIAASLDIPKETIAAALGHGGNTVTDIYIDFDRKKIDEANRRVIDYVLYDKR